MAQMLGKEAEKYAVEIKGLEVPMHDPRGFHGLGLAYMMASRGGCHLRHLCHAIEQGISAYPEAGFEENYQGPESKGKAKLVKLAEDFGIPLNSLLLCHFNMWCLTGHDVVSVLNAITGASYTLADYMECGERIWFLKRAILNMMGIRKKDDRLPQKILTPLSEGAAAGSVPDTELLLSEYYQLRGLDQRGFPKREKLLKLGLEEVSLRLYGNKEDSSKHKPGSAKF
jgi:aldehyde:ferredoxin oxidoreductase